MPHGWPQTQQCVLTSRSGPTAVSTRWPDWYARSGPNFASSSGVSLASAAIGGLQRLGMPDRVLDECQQLPSAGRADFLVVPRLPARDRVVIPEFRFDLNQVGDVC